MAELLTSIWNIALIIIGFGLVIFVHELGHFLAAKWAGIRVHAFAIGFGKAICSFRKGMGFRIGSSEREYFTKARERMIESGRIPDPQDLGSLSVPGVSPTEYRLNWFPFGGYVKMLGQEDANPQVSSAATDSYTRAPVYKRMVVISAGVVMNVILAALLFVIVFRAGLDEVAPIVGDVVAESPAQKAGLEEGDVVLAIDGKRAETFTDLRLAGAMAKRGQAIKLDVMRPGESAVRTISMTPEPSKVDGLLQFGFLPASSSNVWSDKGASQEERAQLVEELREVGFEQVQPGASLVAVNGKELTAARVAGDRTVHVLQEFRQAVEESEGAPVALAFAQPDGTKVMEEFQPVAELQLARVERPEGQTDLHTHLLGLAPVMKVTEVQERAAEQGLRDGDVFARIGSLVWPNMPEGMNEIRAHKGQELSIAVLRDGEIVPLTVNVTSAGTIGFFAGEAKDISIVTGSLEGAWEESEEPAAVRAGPVFVPGSRILSVNGEAVSSFGEIRAALKRATREAAARGSGADVDVKMELTGGAIEEMESRPQSQIAWQLNAEDVKELHALGWTMGNAEFVFEPARVKLKAASLGGAMMMGLRQTNRVMMLTYLTLVRLVQGTVKVQQINGPVGIVHAGSQFAAQGFVYLLFFLALISANLAVINFLPIPIVDGGLMVMLLIEAVTRRPVPIAVQNLATLIGLVFIVTVFLVVTFNDVVRIFG